MGKKSTLVAAHSHSFQNFYICRETYSPYQGGVVVSCCTSKENGNNFVFVSMFVPGLFRIGKFLKSRFLRLRVRRVADETFFQVN